MTKPHFQPFLNIGYISIAFIINSMKNLSISQPLMKWERPSGPFCLHFIHINIIVCGLYPFTSNHVTMGEVPCAIIWTYLLFGICFFSHSSTLSIHWTWAKTIPILYIRIYICSHRAFKTRQFSGHKLIWQGLSSTNYMFAEKNISELNARESFFSFLFLK